MGLGGGLVTLSLETRWLRLNLENGEEVEKYKEQQQPPSLHCTLLLRSSMDCLYRPSASNYSNMNYSCMKIVSAEAGAVAAAAASMFGNWMSSLHAHRSTIRTRIGTT